MSDPIAPARGCAIGFLIGALVWFAFFAALAMIVLQ